MRDRVAQPVQLAERTLARRPSSVTMESGASCTDAVAVADSRSDVRGVAPVSGVHDVGEVDVGLDGERLAEELAVLPLPADGGAGDGDLAGLWRVLGFVVG